MSVRKDAFGRRSVQVEVEVPGTPEEIWEVIATGAGISSWFVPAEVEGRVGGAAIAHFAPGMDSNATVTAWEPPHHFTFEEPNWIPNAPPLATEWVVEARSGGTCVVRVVHSLFTNSDEWDDQIEAIESGWPAFFRILRLYVLNYRGQPCSIIQLMAMAPEPESSAWDALAGGLGLAGAASGQRWSTPSGSPPLAGLVEQVGGGNRPHQMLLRLDEPVPGTSFLFAHAMGGQVCVAIKFYLYGERAAATAAHDQPLWEAWINRQFPAAADAKQVG
jgi:uncharacterized protein YndB with AHSA1/START domain